MSRYSQHADVSCATHEETHRTPIGPHTSKRFGVARLLRRCNALLLAGVFLTAAVSNAPSWGQTPPASPQETTTDVGSKTQTDGSADGKSQTQEKRFASFAAHLTGSAFVGHFTVDGESSSPKEERYELESVTKLPAEDMWLFKARIRYGERDVTVPLPLRVSWAGETPVIVVDTLTIPGLGTFDSRVVVAGNRYAGTWQHGEVGGHLFGRIERAAKPATDPAADKTPAAKSE